MEGSGHRELALAPPRLPGGAAAASRSLAARLDEGARPALVAILLAGLSLRVFVGFFAGLEWFTPDSQNYLRMADGIRAGRPVAFFANGYPLLIASVQGVVPGPLVPACLIGINVAATTLSIALVYALARRLAGRPTPALAAAAVQAITPNQLVYVHYILTESIAAALVLGGCLALLTRRDVLGGVLLGVAVAFRSSLSLLLPFAGALLVWRSGLGRAPARFAAGAGLVGALYAGGLASGAILPSDITGLNLLFSIHSTSTDFEFSKQGFSPDERRHPLRTYLRFAVEHPGRFALQRASSLWELWGPYPTDEERPTWKRLLLGLRFPLLVLASIALVRHRRRVEVWLVSAPLLVNTTLHAAFYSHPRYNFVSEPLATSLAAMVALPAAFLGAKRAKDRVRLETPAGVPAGASVRPGE